jgi:hypothetical protein
MMHQNTAQGIIYPTYPARSPSVPYLMEDKSSANEIVTTLSSKLLKNEQDKITIFYLTLSGLLEIDSSSVQPHFEMKSETSEIKEISEKFIPEDIECDIVVRMPPIKRRRIKVKVKNVRKATPNIVEPEGV